MSDDGLTTYTVGFRAWVEPRGSAVGAKRRRHAAEGQGSAYAGSRRGKRPFRSRSFGERVMVLDTEARIDATQSLTFGRCAVFERGQRECEVPFYGDSLDSTAYATLRDDASRRATTLLSRDESIERVFFPEIDELGTTLVCFNAPFDISRLAVRAYESREGGFTLELSKNLRWPRIKVQSINSKASFVRLSSAMKRRRGGGFPGHFVDLRQAVWALTGEAHSLESACRRFGVKPPVKSGVQHGQVTPEYIEYNRTDVEKTWELYQAVLADYRRHPISLPLDKVYSQASIGKAYFRAMGIRPFLEMQPDANRELLGIAMSCYRGARSETHVRRQVVPVTYVDVLSMYPTVFVLQGLWPWVTANQLNEVEATSEVQHLIDTVTEADLYDSGFWRRLPAFVRLIPDGDILPLRLLDEDTGTWHLADTRVWGDIAQWVPLADIVASIVRGGRRPRIVRAIRIAPTGRQQGLQPVKLLGEIEVDPAQDDFFKKVIEERHRVKSQVRGTSSLDGRAGFVKLERGLKLLANSTSYGITVEFNRKPAGGRQSVTVYGQDTYGSDTHAVEEPGPYCNPLIAPFVTSAAWLILAMMERFLTDHGTTYAIMDTDSMAIIGDVSSVVDDLVHRFEALCPYSFGGSILKIEDINFADASRTRRRRLYAFAISAKRYCLFELRNGRPRIRDAKEHGMGHLLSPRPWKKRWLVEWWQYILAPVLGLPQRRPPWYDQVAVGQLTISQPSLWKPFRNSRAPWSEQVKPFNFMLVAYPKIAVTIDGHPVRPVAPLEGDRNKWPGLAWRDLRTGRRLLLDFDSAPAYLDGVIPVKTYGDILEEYAVHPEVKAADASGQPAGQETVGELQRLRIRVGEQRHIGKEAHDLDVVELLGNADEMTLVYEPDGVSLLSRFEGHSDLEVARMTGVSRQQISNLRKGRTTRPRVTTTERLRSAIGAVKPPDASAADRCGSAIVLHAQPPG